jgi:poly-gamma-glutamate capsule biosynthesis protein CapA/YwtB (metallophosphatase superfamily)
MAVPEPAKLTVAAVGDIMLGTDFPEDRLPEHDGRGLLAEVAPTLRAADVAFGNLEGVLMDGGEPVKVCKDPKVCFLFRSPTRYARTLKEAGFDVMSLANNHARDFGETGRSSSMTALDEAAIWHSGRVGDVAEWEQGGRRVALIAFSFTSGSHPLNDTAGARALVAELAPRNDIVIVSFHGGAEGGDATRVPFTTERFFDEDRGNVVEFARAVVEAGADLVLGHGPHVARAIEVYRDRLIAYSLGNFATYFGISVEGLKGVAPILEATVDCEGRLLQGRIVSAIQVRPDGVRLDAQQRAFHLIRDMTALDLSGGGLLFDESGGFRPARPIEGQCAAGT